MSSHPAAARRSALPIVVVLAGVWIAAPLAKAQQTDAEAPPAAAEPTAPQAPVQAGTDGDPKAAPGPGGPATANAERADELAELDRAVAENRQALQALKLQLQAQEATHQASLATRDAQTAGEAPEAPAVTDPRQAKLSDHGTKMRQHPTVRDAHGMAPRPGNAAVDPSYEGFYPLFGGKVFFKPGGYVKLDAIVDSTRVGNPNKLATSSIPVEGEAQYGSPEQFNLHAKQSRLNLDVRAPTPLGSLRFVYENDFYGDGTSPALVYNLRHLYVQLANVTLGQTWTLFLDADAIPDTLDFAGPGVQAVHRQAQIRYTFSPVRERLHVAISAELPDSDVALLPADGSARRVAPDGLAQVRLEGDQGHLQVAGVVRALAYDSTSGADDVAVGWGVSAATKLHTFGNDALVGSVVYGRGIGRYMQDLGSGYGAYVASGGELETIRTWGLHAGYRHFWVDSVSTQITYGYLDVDAPAPLGASAYDLTHYGQGNVVWSPAKGFFVGAEYIFGYRQTRDGNDGHDHRGQMSFQYKVQ